MAKYRIIYVNHEGDPCHWQAQKRVYLFFWENICGNVSSAHTAGGAILESMGKLKII